MPLPAVITKRNLHVQYLLAYFIRICDETMANSFTFQDWGRLSKQQFRM